MNAVYLGTGRHWSDQSVIFEHDASGGGCSFARFAPIAGGVLSRQGDPRFTAGRPAGRRHVAGVSGCYAPSPGCPQNLMRAQTRLGPRGPDAELFYSGGLRIVVLVQRGPARNFRQGPLVRVFRPVKHYPAPSLGPFTRRARRHRILAYLLRKGRLASARLSGRYPFWRPQGTAGLGGPRGRVDG